MKSQTPYLSVEGTTVRVSNGYILPPVCLQTGATRDDLVALTCIVRFKHIERGRFTYFLRPGAHEEMQRHKNITRAWFAAGLALVILTIFSFASVPLMPWQALTLLLFIPALFCAVKASKHDRQSRCFKATASQSAFGFGKDEVKIRGLCNGALLAFAEYEKALRKAQRT